MGIFLIASLKTWTYLPREGYALAVGFPGRLYRYYEACALDERFAVAVVQEAGDRVGGCKCRRVVEVVVPETERFKTTERFKAKAGPLGSALDSPATSR